MLPEPTDASEIHAQLCRRFLGTTSTSMSVLSEEDAIALALLPANQRYFAEVPERDCRIALITLLLRAEVLPRLGNGAAGHPTGLNLHWTFGRYATGWRMARERPRGGRQAAISARPQGVRDGSVVRCCTSTTCAPSNVVLYRRMRAAHAEER
jgi:hypothetical protein